MHFSSTTAIVALSSLGVTYAAPFVNPQDNLARRKADYEVVNVDGESSSSATPEVETVTQTVQSQVTAPGAPAVPVIVTITASPLDKASSSIFASSTPASHIAPPPGASFFPASNSGFLRRGFHAVGAPADFASSYALSSTASVSATPLAARDGWYSPEVPSAVAPSSLAARQYGGWYSSASGASSSSVSATPSLAARQDGGWYTPSSVASSSTVAPASSLGARQYDGWYTPSSPTPSTSSPSVSLAARQYGGSYSASSPSSSVTPSSLVARQFGGWYSSAPSSSAGPVSSTQSVPVSATPLAARDIAAASSNVVSASAQPTSVVARRADGWYSGASSSSATPSSSFSLPASAIPMAY